MKLESDFSFISNYRGTCNSDDVTSVGSLNRGQMKLESDFNFISNCRGTWNSDDVTLVQPVSNDFTFTNRRFMISIWIYIGYMPFMIAKPYRTFETIGPMASFF